ncbi:hypothetical protein DY000_02016837 [Brassica cretica]|uniref:Uncharacterized protein n=1 Tax=Brassica cretica TaxID=69181 RepID=A0ABQ7D2U3_BRACR|nr:hypothetical protein DY000_02016837 [Brassica cretica]
MLFTPSVISSMDADSESVRESQDDLRREAERGEESGERGTESVETPNLSSALIFGHLSTRDVPCFP